MTYSKRGLFTGGMAGFFIAAAVACSTRNAGEGTAGRVWFSVADQYQQTKVAGQFKSARGTEVNGTVDRRVDAEGIRATGDAVAKVVSEFNVSLDKAVAAKRLTLEAATEARRIAAESASKVFGEVATPKPVEKKSS